jgi:hypothetical protein
MIDVDERLRSELHRLVPTDRRRDWDEVIAGSGIERERVRRRWAAAAAAFVAAAAVLGISTPLGAGLVRSLDDFSAWLTGEPGTPASERAQQAFEEANARSWLRFPQGTELRELITRSAGGTTIELLGFRSGSSALCLRLNVTGKSRWTTLECAPLDELRRAGGPARAVFADQPIGKGDKIAWYGLDRLRSANLQITAGIVTDAVEAIVLEDDSGRHEVDAAANAFLYVAEKPDIGQRVKRIWARIEGRLVPIPFVPTAFGFGGGPAARSVPAPPAPTVQRRVEGGRIAWLEIHEPRGESLDVLPARTQATVLGRGDGPRGRLHTNVLYGRVLTPDLDRPARLVVTLNAHRPGGRAAGLCTWFITPGGAGGGCAPYPDVFAQTLIPSTLTGGGSGAFVTVSGIASDDVARIEALLADGQHAGVPLQDSAFIVDLPRANLPVRLIAYDSAGRVIDVGELWRDFGAHSGPALGRAKSLLRVAGPGGTTAELFVGPSTDGGECMYVRHFVDRHHSGVMTGCRGHGWTGQAVQVGSEFQPPRFVSGRVRPDVRKVRIRFADGSSTTLTPTRGYVLWAAPADRLTERRRAVAAEGLNAQGRVVGRQSFTPPPR